MASHSQLFKTFGKDRFSGHSQLKHSVQRSIRAQIAEQYPWLVENDVLDALLPKKADLTLVKLPEHVQLLIQDGEPLFFSTRDGGWFPTLRLLHKFPLMMPRLRTDKGAIKFVLSGANIMCPGLTSPGATIHQAVDKETPVAIYAEDKQHAMAVGYTLMSTDDMIAVNKGIGVENLHHLNDGLWRTPTL
jgi:PUA domain protein